MIQRVAAALLLCMGLGACNQNDVPPVGQQLFQGAGDVRVIEARIIPTGDSSGASAGGTLYYVIARVELTNDFTADTTPRIENFYLVDNEGTHYQGKDSGSSVLTGISNSQQVLKKGDKREYTVGFRAATASITGTILYEQ